MLAGTSDRVAAYRRRHAIAELRLVRKLMRWAGYDAVPANFYSPIAHLDQLPETTWSQPQPMPGVDWDIEAQLGFIERELSELIAGFDPPLHAPGNATGFYLRNGYFQALDAEILYSMVRRFRPSRVLEFGAGFSTLVIADAIDRNRGEGDSAEHQVFDPHPAEVLRRVEDRIELRAIGATEFDLDRLAELRSGDILFIDTTHTLKPGSDVLHLVLGGVPSLAPGVIVHVHDFYRPFEYPHAMMDVFGCYWQEHYLVQGLLSGSREFEILCANHALRRLRLDRLKELVPGLDEEGDPSSLWIRRRQGETEGSPPGGPK